MSAQRQEKRKLWGKGAGDLVGEGESLAGVKGQGLRDMGVRSWAQKGE